jgi:thiamine biosynthesis lipoprotein
VCTIVLRPIWTWLALLAIAVPGAAWGQTGLPVADTPPDAHESADATGPREPPQGQLQKYQETAPHMGTEFTITFYAADSETATRAMESAFARIAELDRRLSDYTRTSELAQLSAGAPHATPVAVSEDLATVLDRALYWSHQTNGAFDVTVGPLTRLWRRARALKEPPAPDRLAQALSAVGYQAIQLDPVARQAQLTRPGMRLDLGGLAKGYALDEALATLAEQGIHRAVVNGGGDLAASDPPPGSDGWPVALAELDPQSPPQRTLRVRNAAVATSGDAWQSIEFDGRRYSHLVDPTTGLGLSIRSTVTVVAARGIDADALASAMSVMGPERSRQWFEVYRGSPVWMSAIFVADDRRPQLVEAGTMLDSITVQRQH